MYKDSVKTDLGLVYFVTYLANVRIAVLLLIVDAVDSDELAVKLWELVLSKDVSDVDDSEEVELSDSDEVEKYLLYDEIALMLALMKSFPVFVLAGGFFVMLADFLWLLIFFLSVHSSDVFVHVVLLRLFFICLNVHLQYKKTINAVSYKIYLP